MNVADALVAVNESPDADAPVIILRNDGGELQAAPVTAVVMDEANQDLSLLRGEFVEEDAALEGALSAGEVKDALAEVGPDGRSWPLYTVAADEAEGEGLGGSLVSYSANEEIGIFAFLEGPKSAWDD
jgi:hypothetical protein